MSAPPPSDDGTEPTQAVGLPRVPGVRLADVVGHGGFATVYRGHQLSVNRDVAVKIDERRLADARDRRRFSRELIAAGAVSAHPNIVSLYDGGITVDDHPYLVMELYTGGSYAERIKSGGPVPVREVLDVGFAVADALVAAHAEGILHRDVKPGNILISRYGTPALADFGLAALPPAGDGYSVTMESLTPSYAAPEAFGGTEPTAAMDVYALGATLYAMLQGRPPRSDRSGASPPIARLLVMLNDPLPPVGVPGAEDLMAVIWRATAVLPAERYPTAAALRDALAAVRAGRPEASGGLQHRPVARLVPEPDPVPASRNTLSLPDWEHDRSQPSMRAMPPAPVAPRRRSRTPVLALISVAVLVIAAVAATAVILHNRTSGLATRGSSVTSSGTGTDSARPSVSAPAVPLTAPSTAASPSVRSSPSVSVSTPGVVSPVVAPPTSRGSTAVNPVTGSAARPSGAATVAPPVGSCWGGLVQIGDRVSAQQVSSCTQPHYYEAYATGLLASTTPTPYADDIAKDPAVQRTCTQASLQTYLGAGHVGRYDTDVIPPSDVAFLQGDKGFWCVARVEGTGEITGSLKN